MARDKLLPRRSVQGAAHTWWHLAWGAIGRLWFLPSLAHLLCVADAALDPALFGRHHCNPQALRLEGGQAQLAQASSTSARAHVRCASLCIVRAGICALSQTKHALRSGTPHSEKVQMSFELVCASEQSSSSDVDAKIEKCTRARVWTHVSTQLHQQQRRMPGRTAQAEPGRLPSARAR